MNTIWNWGDPLAIGVAAAYAFFALWKFSLLVYAQVVGPVKQSKKHRMTKEVTIRINSIILVYTFYLFYELVMAVYQQPGADLVKISFDIVIKFVFAAVVLGMVGQMLFDLHKGAGLGGAGQSNVAHLISALNKRGLSVLEFCVLMPLLAGLKYCVQGSWPVLLGALGIQVW